MEKEFFDFEYYDLKKIYDKLEAIFQEDEYGVEVSHAFPGLRRGGLLAQVA
jgi:hypothetical protein